MKKEWIVTGWVNGNEYTYEIKICAENLRMMDAMHIEADGVYITLPEEIESIRLGES